MLRIRDTLPTSVLLAGCLALLSLPLRADEAAENEEFFEREVRPVLVEQCGKCHSGVKSEGGFSLESAASLAKGGDTGPAIVPGEPDRSLLIQAIRHEGDVIMPPENKLSDRQIASLTLWVKMGAPWPKKVTLSGSGDVAEKQRQHWAFQPIANPPVPVLEKADWGRTPIDAFILQSLNAHGLQPSPVADRQTLIRRLTWDLTGLPPTPAEVSAFLEDARPDAIEQLVDRLLASPHYGEQWGRHWLDVARYADTKGYVYGREERFWTQAWSYRDWVVRALNADLPYDQFVTLQLAGDQVATHPDDLAAMGFLTLGRRFLGVTHDIMDDRIDAVSRGMLGLTVACARCHDHKYDPIPTRDYYSLYGVFRTSAEKQVFLPAVNPAVDATAFQQGLTERETKRQTELLAKRQEASALARSRTKDYLLAQLEISKYPAEGFDVILAKTDLIPAFVRRWQQRLLIAGQRPDPVFRAWTAFEQIPVAEFSQEAGPLVAKLIAGELGPLNPRVAASLQPVPSTMAEVVTRYGQLFEAAEAEWQAALKVAADAGQPAPTQLADAAGEELRQVLYGEKSPCHVPDDSIVNIEFFFDSGTLNEMWRLQNEVDRWLINSPQAPPVAVVLEDRQPWSNPRVFKRGNPATQGEETPRQFLEALSGPDRQPFANGSGRRELAESIVKADNPLTARVIVNRVWMHHFGAGLVKTPSDFGLRAEAPSHPELLDWLATRLIAENWSLKWLHRQIALSAVYQQVSTGPADVEVARQARLSDPENRLLWRMAPHRLTFEELRDGLLASSGLLDDRLGGKPVDIFAAPYAPRRTMYGLIDRQFLAGVLRAFDFANPDLHIPQRSETTVPQQALFLLNHPFLAQQAKALVEHPEVTAATDAAGRVDALFRQLYQHAPEPSQRAAAVAFVAAQQADAEQQEKPSRPNSWKYGYGPYDPQAGTLQNFLELPHFNGNAWQGGGAWPDATLGWAQLTATGGHAGNDLQHAVVRRWVAPRAITVAIHSALEHPSAAGDGVRASLLVGKQGRIKTADVHHRTEPFEVERVDLAAGDTIDFIVDVREQLNHDEFLWAPVIEEILPAGAAAAAERWAAQEDFVATAPLQQLKPWEQLALVLLLSNEFAFVD